jgi:Fur family transcriptional regulator, iron response regulator
LSGCKPGIERALQDGDTGALYFPAGVAYNLSMQASGPAPNALERLRGVGLRPTRQRLALARLLFAAGDRHVTAEQLHSEALAAAIPVSLATVYNTLHQFTDAGLLREVVAEPGRSYFDTNIDDHHHFFWEESGVLQDIPGESVVVSGLPLPPQGTAIERVEVIVRVRPESG